MITRGKPLSCANLLAKHVKWCIQGSTHHKFFHHLLCLPGDIFPGIRPYFSKELRPFYRPSSIHSHSYITKCVRAFKLCYFRRAETI